MAAAQYTVGETLNDGSTVVSDTFTVLSDGSSIEVMTDSKGNGLQVVTYATGTAPANQASILANILTRQSQVQSWIAANPSGATLTAAQTLTLAEMLDGLCKLLLNQFSSTTGT